MATRTQSINPATLSEAAKRTLSGFFSDIDKMERGEIKLEEKSQSTQNDSGPIILGLSEQLDNGGD